jgi:SagB-type dehydrogenase family enzyme
MSETIGRDFMSLTRYEHLQSSPQQRKEPQPPLELLYATDQALISLPDPAGLPMPAIDLRTVIEQRVSVRKYSSQALSIDELSLLLWCTQGIKKVVPNKVTFRTVPSAGARHAFETYLLINRVENIVPGLYRFLALENALLAVDLSSDIARRVMVACLEQDMVEKSAVTFLWSAVVERMTWRYVQRGYRYLHLDAGHVCQNLYLAGETMGCGTCAIAAFDDDKTNACLGLDGESMFVIYVASLGKKEIGN